MLSFRSLAVSAVSVAGLTVQSFAAFVYPGTHTIESSILGRTVSYSIAVPQTYITEPAKTYPILFALHGHGASYTSWTSMTALVNSLDTYPMVLCAFDGGNNYYVDVTDFFFDELIPEITSKFKGDGQYACTGFSMGGYGTWHFMLTQPDLFSSISALSGAFYASSVPSGSELDPRLDAAKTAGTAIPPAYMDCGSNDSWLPNSQQMRNKMNSLGYALEYQETAGAGHDWAFWSSASPALAEFHHGHFDYTSIIEFGIPDALPVSSAIEGIYDLQGRRVSGPDAPGMYLEVRSGRAVKKLIVR